MASDADRIRLAIALVALKFKPPDLSFASYILDLRSQFAPSIPLAPTTDGSWRAHALSMERSYAELQARYEAEQIKSFAAEQLASSTSKKKSKKKTSAVAPPEPVAPESRPDTPLSSVELKAILKKLHDRINFPTTLTILGADSILSPLNSVLQLTSLPDPHPALLLSVTIRTIEAIANTLKPMILRLTPNVPSEVDTLKTLNVLLYHVLDVVIPCLTPSEALPLRTSTLGSTSSGIDLEGHVDTLLERISALILIPLIHSFATLSHTYLDAVFIHSAAGNATTPTSAGSAKPPGHKSGKPVAASGLPSDVRGDALSLFRVVFRVLNTQLQCRIQQAPNLYLSLHTLRASLILEAIREFERISSPVPVSRPSPAPAGNTDVPVSAGSSDIDMGRPAARVKKLAMKDARWYMCTVLHIVFSETSETPSVAYAPLTVSITPEHPEAGEEEEEPSEVEAQRNTQTGASHILDQGISAALYRLVTRCKRTASISRHDETQTSKFTGIMGSDVLGQDEGSMGKEGQGPHVQPQGRVGDRRTVPNTPINQGKSGEHKAQSAIGDSSLDVGTDPAPAVGVGVNAGGRLTKGSRRAQGVESGPLGPTTRKRLEGLGDDEMIDLDEIEYGMLLGVIERYWVWKLLNHGQ